MGILNLNRQIADHKMRDLQKRVEPFLKDYKEIVKKNRCAFKPQIIYTTDGIKTNLVVVDFTEELRNKKIMK